jgi:hypothetical protein
MIDFEFVMPVRNREKLSYVLTEKKNINFLSFFFLNKISKNNFLPKSRIKTVVFSKLYLINSMVNISELMKNLFDHQGISWPQYLKACHTQFSQNFQKFYQKSKS